MCLGTLDPLAGFGLHFLELEWEISIADLRVDKGEPCSAQWPFFSGKGVIIFHNLRY